jgi:hypothetical protein
MIENRDDDLETRPQVTSGTLGTNVGSEGYVNHCV